MAIQQVGGQGVYVITGSGRDPRKTTSGQSWADLVTQQKYMLIKEAQREALRQMEQEQLSFQDRQQRQEQLRQNLQSQIEAERKGIEDLRIKQITLNEAREIENQRIKSRSPEYKPTKAPSGGTSVTRTIPTEREYVGDLRREIDGQTQRQKRLRADRAKLVAAEKEKSTFAEIAPELLSATELQDLTTFAQAKAKLDESLIASENAQASAQLLRDKYQTAAAGDKANILERAAKKTIRTSGGGGGGGQAVTPAAKTLEDLGDFTGFDPEIERRQKRMRELQAEMDALEFEERPTFNGIDEMRRVYGESFPEQPRQRLRDRFRRQPQAAPSAQSIVEQPMEAPVEPGPNLGQMESYGVADEPMMIGGSDNQRMMGQQALAPRQQEMEVLGMDSEFQQPTPEVVTEDRADVVTEDRADVGQYLGDRATPQETTLINQFLNNPEKYRGPRDQFRRFGPGYTEPEIDPNTGSDITGAEENVLIPPALPNPNFSPTPKQGERFIEQMILGLEPETPQVGYAAQFEDVKFGTAAQKQSRALELIINASKEMGPTSPEYNKAKVQILTELQKTMDPKEFRKQKKVERVMDKNPKDYMALAKTVRGLSEKDARLVMSLFAVSSDTKLEDIDKLYKSARNEISNNGNMNKRERKKALEFLELYYMAIIDENANFGK
jgi:hypothetical protein